MEPDQLLPREVKAIDTASLRTLEEQACQLDLSQRLAPAWVLANAVPDGAHYLWPASWHTARTCRVSDGASY
ncbi:hypothetical protein [Streptomyces melanogenes]|uniref:hypothetical protein n=1 Tax=Streptomyces melanogenes TaxID=67326 RepID=UPI0037A0E6C8